jgi:hypothetical protein
MNTIKTTELGRLWLEDNLRIAEQNLKKVQESLRVCREGAYKEQVKILEDSYRAVVEVWRNKLEALR